MTIENTKYKNQSMCIQCSSPCPLDRNYCSSVCKEQSEHYIEGLADQLDKKLKEEKKCGKQLPN